MGRRKAELVLERMTDLQLWHALEDDLALLDPCFNGRSFRDLVEIHVEAKQIVHELRMRALQGTLF